MYQISQLFKFPNLVHGFSVVDEGNMATLFSGQTADPDEIFVNRKKFLERLDINIDDCVGMWHQQSNKVGVVSKTKFEQFDFQKIAKLDGLITNKKGRFLFMVVADCLSIVIYDPKKKVVGLIHAGWKGVDLEIPKVAVESLLKEYGCDPEDLIIGFGPVARKDFFVKENPEQKDDLKWKEFVENDRKSDLYKIDFVGLARKQLIDVGVKNSNIFDCDIDTIKNKRFFSHYRDKKAGVKDLGRFACVVGMR